MKTTLAKAVALAATLGAAASAHAVNVNPEGLGQVLLYPIYSTENGQYSAVHVTNTTDEYKAVKVRFLEGMNSQEVLDFNLYLSPFDVWTGVITQTAEGARLTTQDTSCTAGAIGNGLDFRTTLFANGTDSVKDASRTRVGHVEVIEMGELDPTDAATANLRAAILHTDGVPGNCDTIRAAWRTGGVWRTTPSAGILPPGGGLYGSVTLVNVDNGVEIAADAVAIDNWTSGQQHNLPGDEAPSLDAGDTLATFKNGTQALFVSGTDAVSAVLMKQNLSNDYAYGAGLNAQTDWVVTFPTKRNYVNQTPAVAPFTEEWDPATSAACEPITLTVWDREERENVIDEDQISPRPPVAGISLCHETNVLSIGDSNIIGGEHVRNQLNSVPFQTGWMRLSFADAGNVLTPLAGGASAAPLLGLPAIGFAAVQIQNGDVGGLLSNYAASYVHKATTSRDL